MSWSGERVLRAPLSQSLSIDLQCPGLAGKCYEGSDGLRKCGVVTEGWPWAAGAQGWGGNERKGGCFRESATTKKEEGTAGQGGQEEVVARRDRLAGRALCPQAAGTEGESCSWGLQGPALSASADVTSS